MLDKWLVAPDTSPQRAAGRRRNNMRLFSLFDQFIRYLKVEKGVTAATVKSYSSCFARFAAFGGQFTTDRCREFQYNLTEQGLSSATVNLHLTTLASFAAWAVRRKYLAENPIDNLTRPKRHTRLPAVPKFSLVTEWLSNGLDLRTKALVALMAYGGLRCAEVVALDVGDYDPSFGLRRVLGKGGHESGVALPETAQQILNGYLLQRRGQDRDPMFVTHYWTVGRREVVERMKPHRVYRLVKALGKRWGMPELHPHSFRHACGTELLIRTNNLRAVQLHLRHTDPSTTALYTRIAQPELARLVGALDGPRLPTPPPSQIV